MADGNEIVAVTHDGVEHHFPAGTPDAVIDTAVRRYLNPPKDKIVQLPSGERVQFPGSMADADVNKAIEQYLTPPKDPYGFSSTGTGGGPEAEMLRRHARSRAGKDFTTPEPGVIPWLGRQVGGGLEAVGELAQAIPGMLKTAGDVAFGGAPGVPNLDQAKAIQSLLQPQVEQWQKGEETKGVESIARRGAALIPFAGPLAAESGESFGRGEVGRGLVQAVTALTARPRFGEVGPQVGVRTQLQRYLNIGPELTERAVAERTAKVAEIEKDNQQTLLESRFDHQEKVSRVQSDYNKQVADIEADNRAALLRARSGYEAKEADYHAKLQTVRTANEEARQTQMQKQRLMTDIQGHAQDLTEKLTQLNKQTRQQAKAMYPEINGTVDSVDVRNLVEDAITSNVRGTEKPPSMLGAMLKDLTPEDPLAQASVFRGAGSTARATRSGISFGDLPPAVRERIMPSLNPEERVLATSPSRGGFTESIDADRLHGYITELGEELQRDLSGDERAAVTQTRAGLVNMLRKMADSEGKLTQFENAQKNWSQYENTFNKTWSDRRGVPSPIAKALAAKDPVTGQVIPERAASILLKDLNYKQAQQMLGRYGNTGSDVLQLLKEKADQITTLPKSLKELPEPTAPTSAAIKGLKDVPHEPLGPTMAAIGRLKELPSEVDPRALKDKALQETALGLRSMKGIRAALDIASLVHFMYSGNPISLAYPILRRALSYGLETPIARSFLTRPSASEMTMVSPRKVYPSKAAAMKAIKGGYKPSEKAAAMSAER